MPTYVYKFIDSDETFEVQQSFDEPSLTEAPHPSDGGSRPVRKVFTPVGITFKGNGFYKTDSRGSKNGKAGSSTTSSSDRDSSKDSSKDTTSKDTTSKDTTSKDTTSKDRGSSSSSAAASTTSSSTSSD